MPFKMTLKVELAKRDMTQKQLADLTKIRPPTISAICNNTIKRIPVDAIEKICDVLDCKLEDWATCTPTPTKWQLVNMKTGEFSNTDFSLDIDKEDTE